MYHSDTEILFPMRVAPGLRELRGRKWRHLVERAIEAPDGSPEQLAFGLVLIRLAGCLTCHPDSYRALRGCTACATHVIRRHRGEDEDLGELYERALVDVEGFLMERESGQASLSEPALRSVEET